MIAFIIALLGLTVGSFLNVCIDRLPAGKSIVSPPSQCDACQRRILKKDLIPVLSYIRLRGRCRYCGAKIPLRSPLVEVITAVLFLLAYWRFLALADPNYFGFVFTVFWGSIFLVIMFIDQEHQLILNKITLPAAIVALVILAVNSLCPELGLFRGVEFWPHISILSGLMGAAIGFIFFMIVLLIYPGGMGMGDVKLAGLIGLVVGFPLTLVALFIGIFIGGLVAVVLLLTGKKDRKAVIPYGVFLGIGPIVVLLYGTGLLHWYIGLY